MVRRYFSIRVLLPAITGIMTIALVAMFAFLAVQANSRRNEIGRIPVIVDISYDLFAAIQDLRLERGTVNRALAEPEGAAPELLKQLVTLRATSATSLDAALVKLSAFKVEGADPRIEEIAANEKIFAVIRDEVDQALKQPLDSRDEDLIPRWVAANGRLVGANRAAA